MTSPKWLGVAEYIHTHKYIYISIYIYLKNGRGRSRGRESRFLDSLRALISVKQRETYAFPSGFDFGLTIKMPRENPTPVWVLDNYNSRNTRTGTDR